MITNSARNYIFWANYRENHFKKRGFAAKTESFSPLIFWKRKTQREDLQSIFSKAERYLTEIKIKNAKKMQVLTFFAIFTKTEEFNAQIDGEKRIEQKNELTRPGYFYDKNRKLDHSTASGIGFQPITIFWIM